MPFHALVTRRSRCPDPAAALACDGVTRSRQRPPHGTLTFLAEPAWGVWVTVVTCGTPGGTQRGGHWYPFPKAAGRTGLLSYLSQCFPSYPSGQAVHL